MHRPKPILVRLGLVSLLAAGCAGAPAPGPILDAPAAVGSSTPVACADMLDEGQDALYKLKSREKTVDSPTGNQLHYIVIGEGNADPAEDRHVLVLFNGTDGVWADWPVDMLYDDGDGSSPCEDYYLVLFDYAGIGGASTDVDWTFDAIANDVLAILDRLDDDYGLSFKKVSVAGWSLGALAAWKFAFLFPDDAGYSLENLIMIATKPSPQVTTSTFYQAPCVTDTLAIKADHCHRNVSSDVASKTAYELTYPYDGQTSSFLTTACTVTGHDDTQIDLSIEIDCDTGTVCADFYEILEKNTYAWEQRSNGQRLPCDIFDDERTAVAAWNDCACVTATDDGGLRATSGESCTTETGSCVPANSAPMACTTTPATGGKGVPSCNAPAPLQAERLVVINGEEDLYIQHCWGTAVAAAYNAHSAGPSSSYLCSHEDAGHAVLYSDPDYVRGLLDDVLGDEPPSGCSQPSDASGCIILNG